MNVFVFACAQVHQSATVPVPEGSLVPQCWFMSMCYGLRCPTRDWLWTEGPVSQRPRSYVKEVDGSQSTGESQHFLPCQHLLPELLAGRIPIEALNKRPGGTTAGRVSVSLHSLSVAGCMDSIWVIGCVCAEENIWNVMRSEWNTRWCIITEQVWYTLNNKKYAMTCPRSHWRYLKIENTIIQDTFSISPLVYGWIFERVWSLIQFQWRDIVFRVSAQSPHSIY